MSLDQLGRSANVTHDQMAARCINNGCDSEMGGVTDTDYVQPPGHSWVSIDIKQGAAGETTFPQSNGG